MTVLVAPISSLVRRSMQSATRIFDISQPSGQKRQSFDLFFTDWLNQQKESTDHSQHSDLALSPCEFILLAGPSQYTVELCRPDDESLEGYIAQIKDHFKNIWDRINDFINANYDKYPCEDPLTTFMPVLSGSTPLDERGSCVEDWHRYCTLSQRGSVIKRPVRLECGMPGDYPPFPNEITLPPITDINLFGKRKAACTALVVASRDVVIKSTLRVDQKSCNNKGTEGFGLLATGNDVSNFYLEGIQIMNAGKHNVGVAFLGGFERYGSTRQTVNISAVPSKTLISQIPMNVLRIALFLHTLRRLSTH